MATTYNFKDLTGSGSSGDGSQLYVYYDSNTDTCSVQFIRNDGLYGDGIGNYGTEHIWIDLQPGDQISLDGGSAADGDNDKIYISSEASHDDVTPTKGKANFYDASGNTYFEFDHKHLDSGDQGDPPAVPCFAAGTLIQTDRGQFPVETLRPGDMVVTRDHSYQPVRWMGQRKLDAQVLADKPNLRPIRIRAGALGPDTPENDLIVSPQHRVLVRSKIARRMFDADEVLVASKHLCGLAGIEMSDDLAEIEYYHMLFDRHEIVISNCAETESMHIGPQALKSVSTAAQKEILELLPVLEDRDYRPVAARALVSGRQGRKLAAHHVKNCMPLNPMSPTASFTPAEAGRPPGLGELSEQ